MWYFSEVAGEIWNWSLLGVKGLKPWPNGTPNYSSQVTKSKLACGGWPNCVANTRVPHAWPERLQWTDFILFTSVHTCSALSHHPFRAHYRLRGLWGLGTAKSNQVARKPFNSSIVWLRPRSHRTITKKNLARVGSTWPRWPNAGKRGSSWTKIWAWSNSWSNSSQLGGETNTQLHPS